MLKPRTLKVLALMLLAYGLVWLPAAFAPTYVDSPAAVLLIGPLLSVYFLHKLGVPGLLEHNGLCGSGWCSPTAFGWVFTAVVLLMAAWLVAWAIASLTTRSVAR